MQIKKLLAACALGVFCTYGTSAIADWQYTNWQMARDRVVSASRGKAVALTPEEQAAHRVQDVHETVLLKAPYTAGQFSFTAYFRFDDATGRLTNVQLEMMEPEKGPVLLGNLRAKYGEPANEKSEAVMDFANWYVGNDQVSYLAIGGRSASVSYQPRITSDNKGL